MIIGVDYKEIFNEDSKSTQLKDGLEMIKTELELLLNFKKYSLFFGNEMGLDLEKYIGLTNRKATFNLIKAEIEDLFIKYKRVQLRKLELNFEKNSNSILINVTVVMPGSNLNDITIPFKVQN
jgi:uncharacterized membrane protein